MNYRPRFVLRVGMALILLGALTGCTSSGDESGGTTPSDPPRLVDGPGLVERPGTENANMAVRQIKVHLAETRQNMRSIEENVRHSRYANIAEHGEEISELASEIRAQTVSLRETDAEIVMLLVDRVQHAAHELEEAAGAHDHDGMHHAIETLDAELTDLNARVDRM